MATFAQSLTAPAALAGATDDAFEKFFCAAYDRLVRALTPVAGSITAAEELVQEAMARAYERWHRVAVMESPTGYVYTTAVNLHRRSQRRAILRGPIGRTASAAPDPAEEIVSKNELLNAIARLPAGPRDALLLVEWLGLDATTAGRLLGIKPSSVRARTHRARAALREQLTR